MKRFFQPSTVAMAIVTTGLLTSLAITFAQTEPDKRETPANNTPTAETSDGRVRARVIELQPGPNQPAAPPAGLRFPPGVAQGSAFNPGYGFSGGAFAFFSSEEHDLEVKAHDLIGKLREAKDDATKTAVKDEMKDVVTKQFNIRQKQREQELKQLEEQLKKLRTIQERREAARDDIINDRVKQFVRESEGLNWGAQTGPQPPNTFEVIAGNRQPFISIEAVPNPNGIVQETVAGGFGGSGPAHRAWGALNHTLPAMIPEGAQSSTDEIKIFAVTQGEQDAADLITVVNSLLRDGRQRAPRVTMTTFNNKIIAKGQPEVLKTVESILLKLQEETTEKSPGGGGGLRATPRR